MIAVPRRPSWTGAGEPSGAVPQVVVPQLLQRAISWHSVPRPVMAEVQHLSPPAMAGADQLVRPP
jgi:hypothetical protein